MKDRSRPGAAGRHPIQIAAIWAERYAQVRRATWIGSPLCRRLLLFLFCYFSLRVVPASKQSLAEHVIRHPDVMRQNCRPKTKLGLATKHTRHVFTVRNPSLGLHLKASPAKARVPLCCGTRHRKFGAQDSGARHYGWRSVIQSVLKRQPQLRS